MIKSLRLTNFKNFACESLRMGPFTVVAGANASGKSNIRDALRFLHGVGRGYTLAEILGGKYGPGGEVQWEGIRGAPNEVARAGEDSFEIVVKMDIETAAGGQYEIGYEIGVSSNGGYHVRMERLGRSPWRPPGSDAFNYGGLVYDSHPGSDDPVHRQGDDARLLLRMGKSMSQRGPYGQRVQVRPDQPALMQLKEHNRILRSHKERASEVAYALSNMRFLEPSPARLRQPSFPGQTILGDRGDNFPTVLKETCADSERREALIQWTRELTPMDVRDFKFVEDQFTGRIQVVFVERNGQEISAYSASDGTLRFLAILTALLGNNPAGFYFFEEIDTGIHPSRLRLLLDLIEDQTARSKTQVLTTTHSPTLLAMVRDDTFNNTAVVCRPPNTDDAVIRQIANLPNAEALRAKQGLGRLHESGWLEDAVFLHDQQEQEDVGN